MSDGWLSSYGGIFEKGVKEYTLDDFYALQLDKLDRFTCLKPSNVVIDENADDESSDEDDDDEDDEENHIEDDDDTAAGELIEEVQQLAKNSDDLGDIVEEVKTLKVSKAEEVQLSFTRLELTTHIV